MTIVQKYARVWYVPFASLMIPNKVSLGAKIDKAYNNLYTDFEKQNTLVAGVANDLRALIFGKYMSIVRDIDELETYLEDEYFKN